MLNVHPSLLPRWRGAAPIERAIEAGDEETGVTIMRPTAELDAGPLCLQRAEPIHPDDDYGSPLAAARGARRRAVDRGPRRRAGLPRPARAGGDLREQDRSRATACSTRAGPLDELERRVRALTPHIGAYVEPADGRAAGRHPRRPRGRAWTTSRPVASKRATPRLLYGASPGPRWSCSEVQPPGKQPHGIGSLAPCRGNRGTVSTCPPTTEDPTDPSGPQCPACGEPGLRGTNLAARYRCVHCLRRFELRSECPNCGAHSTIARMSRHRERHLPQLRRQHAVPAI